MIRNSILILALITLVSCKNSQTEKDDSFPVLSGKYLGQEEPGLQPEIFAPDIVSTGMTEINAAFSPDYKEFYFTIIKPDRNYVIIQMVYDGKQWSKPEVAPFSGIYPDADPFITQDGKWLYFVSKRPTNKDGIVRKDWDIWRMSKTNTKWSEPQRLDSTINSAADEVYPTLTRNGNLYFSSGKMGENNRDIFYAKSSGSEFESAVRLSDSINSHWEGDIYISPEEDYMIFRSYGRKEGGGLYITFNQDGEWNLPIRMDKEINRTGNELCPMVSPDGKFFFFSSAYTDPNQNTSEKATYKKIKEDFINSYNYPQMGKTDIYWVDSKIIERYRSISTVD